EMGTGKVFEDPDHLWHDNICCALVFNGQFVDEHHDLAKAFTKAYLDAGKYLDEHPKAQEEISLKYMKFNDPVIERSLKVIGFKDLALTEDRYNALVHHMTHIDLIKNVPSYSEFVDQSLLP
ncbi:MAG: ABC transporter substrate-binding protein, partial [Veillonella sp.]|nr:ABC transporter substrate-binding protein [Veillonella sp.]